MTGRGVRAPTALSGWLAACLRVRLPPTRPPEGAPYPDPGVRVTDVTGLLCVQMILVDHALPGMSYIVSTPLRCLFRVFSPLVRKVRIPCVPPGYIGIKPLVGPSPARMRVYGYTHKPSCRDSPGACGSHNGAGGERTG